jgi:dTDP-4-dehydrorhamnose reductase
MDDHKHRILILGASGFVGNTLYRELLSFFETYGTYCRQEGPFGGNQVFFRYCAEKDSINDILDSVMPTVIISALQGPYTALLQCHAQLVAYCKNHHRSRLLFLSSNVVFDGHFLLPAYENDKPVPESAYGNYKYAVERLLLESIPAQTAILRLPFVLGVHSPLLFQLRQAAKHRATFEVFPNLIITVTTADKIAQQVHYIINQGLDGIFHLASDDMVHHEDLFTEICEKIGSEMPIFKRVYRRNDDNYLAILPKHNKLPNAYRISVSEVIEACTLHQEISTYK